LEGGAPAEGSYDFEFRLFDAASLGDPVGSLVSIADQPLVEGRFTVLLDFGDVFDGARLWLEAAVRPGDSSGAFTTLSPRQPLTAAPAAHSLRPGASIVGSLGNEAVIRAQNTSLDAQSGGLYGQSDSPEGAGVYGVGSNGGYGVYGLTMATGSDNTPGVFGVSGSPEGRGVYGYATSDTGRTYGVFGRSRSPEGIGVRGLANAESGPAYGIQGTSNSTDGAGVYGFADATSGANYGVHGESSSADGTGVYGEASRTGVWGVSSGTSGSGILGEATASSGTTHGVYGEADSSEGTGVYGRAIATDGETFGVYGRSRSTLGIGVYGWADAFSGPTRGVTGKTSSTEGIGVYGLAATTSGSTYGVWGSSVSTEGTGVYGWAGADSGSTYGVQGKSYSPEGTAVYGMAAATSGTNYGVYGQTDSTWGVGVAGFQPGYDASDLGGWFEPGGLFGGRNGVLGVSKEDGGVAVFGWNRAINGFGVYGYADATTGANYGLYGQTDSTDGYGVYGFASATSGTNYGVYGSTNSSDGYAGYFVGDVYVNGDFASTSKSFKIDHPLDPANQYLYHYSVESAERLNQYTGNVTLDEDGQAWVELPAWFEAINADIRYQLTCIGGFAPVYIAQEVQDNRFQIAGGQPGLKVSWMVTAVRNDPYAQQHPPVVEQDKPEAERGTYLDPELYGQPEEMGTHYQQQRDVLELQGSEGARLP
jgi:hypothetical protein